MTQSHFFGSKTGMLRA